MNHKPLIWTSNSLYVDIDTGEQITKHKATTDYYIINKTKKTTYNEHNTRGHTEWTNQCRRKPEQGSLFTT